jgi:hypothetical protein
VLGDAAHNFGTRGIHQPSELFQMFGNMPCVFGSLTGRSYQYGALDRITDRDQWTDRAAFLVIQSIRGSRGLGPNGSGLPGLHG